MANEKHPISFHMHFLESENLIIVRENGRLVGMFESPGARMRWSPNASLKERFPALKERYKGHSYCKKAVRNVYDEAQML